MKLYSTNNPEHIVSLSEAVIRGLSPDGGLYMPTTIPQLSPDFFSNIKNLSFPEIAFSVSQALIGEDIPGGELKKIINLFLRPSV